jgi:hypothetical protein
VSFDVVADWWTALRVENMDKFALEKELKAAGIVVMKGGVAITTMREALKAHNNGDGKLPIQEVFTKIDEDDSGYLDKVEVEAAAGILGSALGFLMTSDMQTKAFAAMGPDEDGQVTIENFEKWSARAPCRHHRRRCRCPGHWQNKISVAGSATWPPPPRLTYGLPRRQVGGGAAGSAGAPGASSLQLRHRGRVRYTASKDLRAPRPWRRRRPPPPRRPSSRRRRRSSRSSSGRRRSSLR